MDATTVETVPVDSTGEDDGNVDGTLAQRRYTDEDDAALVDAALACVRWDESVDVDRLLALEYQHDLAIVSDVVANAIRRIGADESLATAPRITAPSTLTRGERPNNRVVMCHEDGAWHVMGRLTGAFAWNVPPSLTGAQLAGYLTLCARHLAFSLRYYDGGANGQCFTPERTACFGHMWLARLAATISRRAGAWTGIEIMRTRNLCLALIDIVDARRAKGPLAPVGERRTPGMTTPTTEDGDNGGGPPEATAESMREALDHMALLESQGVAFVDVATARECGDVACTETIVRCTLLTVRNMLDRLYATDAYFLKLIGPAEYEAMVAGAPLAATFFR